MSVLYGPLPFLAGWFLSLVVIGDTPVGWIIGIVVGFGAVALWHYSPLPNHNGGYMAPNDRGTYWGWSK